MANAQDPSQTPTSTQIPVTETPTEPTDTPATPEESESTEEDATAPAQPAEPAIVPTTAPGGHINAYKEELRQAIGSVQSELNKAAEAVERLIERVVPGTPHDPQE